MSTDKRPWMRFECEGTADGDTFILTIDGHDEYAELPRDVAANLYATLAHTGLRIGTDDDELAEKAGMPRCPVDIRSPQDRLLPGDERFGRVSYPVTESESDQRAARLAVVDELLQDFPEARRQAYLLETGAPPPDEDPDARKRAALMDTARRLDKPLVTIEPTEGGGYEARILGVTCERARELMDAFAPTAWRNGTPGARADDLWCTCTLPAYLAVDECIATLEADGCSVTYRQAADKPPQRWSSKDVYDAAKVEVRHVKPAADPPPAASVHPELRLHRDRQITALRKLRDRLAADIESADQEAEQPMFSRGGEGVDFASCAATDAIYEAAIDEARGALALVEKHLARLTDLPKVAA